MTTATRKRGAHLVEPEAPNAGPIDNQFNSSAQSQPRKTNPRKRAAARSEKERSVSENEDWTSTQYSTAPELDKAKSGNGEPSRQEQEMTAELASAARGADGVSIAQAASQYFALETNDKPRKFTCQEDATLVAALTSEYYEGVDPELFFETLARYMPGFSAEDLSQRQKILAKDTALRERAIFSDKTKTNLSDFFQEMSLMPSQHASDFDPDKTSTAAAAVVAAAAAAAAASNNLTNSGKLGPKGKSKSHKKASKKKLARDAIDINSNVEPSLIQGGMGSPDTAGDNGNDEDAEVDEDDEDEDDDEGDEDHSGAGDDSHAYIDGAGIGRTSKPSKARGKNTGGGDKRHVFTLEDDAILFDLRRQGKSQPQNMKRLKLGGALAFARLEEEHSRHTAKSWKDRYNKLLKFINEEDEEAYLNDSVARKRLRKEARGERRKETTRNLMDSRSRRLRATNPNSEVLKEEGVLPDIDPSRLETTPDERELYELHTDAKQVVAHFVHKWGVSQAQAHWAYHVAYPDMEKANLYLFYATRYGDKLLPTITGIWSAADDEKLFSCDERALHYLSAKHGGVRAAKRQEYLKEAGGTNIADFRGA